MFELFIYLFKVSTFKRGDADFFLYYIVWIAVYLLAIYFSTSRLYHERVGFLVFIVSFDIYFLCIAKQSYRAEKEKKYTMSSNLAVGRNLKRVEGDGWSFCCCF